MPEIDPDSDPFADGHEDRTPPEVYAVRPNGGGTDTPGWTVRVVPNLYPAFDGDAPMVVSHLGPTFTQAPASGIHEVLVFSPEHDAALADLNDPQTSLVMAAIRDRIEEHSNTPGLRYSQAIVNSGREPARIPGAVPAHIVVDTSARRAQWMSSKGIDELEFATTQYSG